LVSNRRRRAWVDFIFNLTLADGAALQSQDILFDMDAAFTTVTVTRLIGQITIRPEDPDATNTGAMRIVQGIGVASAEAHAGNVVPNPSVTPEYPTLGWLWRDLAAVSMQNASGTMESYQFPEIRFDLGANRKVDKGILFYTADSTTINGTGYTVRLTGLIRALCLT